MFRDCAYDCGCLRVCTVWVHLSVHLLPWMHVPMCLCMACVCLCLFEEGALTFDSSQDPHILMQARLGKTWDRAPKVK